LAPRDHDPPYELAESQTESATMLDKRIPELTVDDVNALVANGTPEDEQLEYKRTLPTRDGRDGSDDPWIATAGQQKFGNRARDEIAQEIVAFANRDGGIVVIGMVDNDRRAQGLNLIPQCHDLAGRLERSIGEIVEPKLTGLAARGQRQKGHSKNQKGPFTKLLNGKRPIPLSGIE
jgi:hypothetical protein